MRIFLQTSYVYSKALYCDWRVHAGHLRGVNTAQDGAYLEHLSNVSSRGAAPFFSKFLSQTRTLVTDDTSPLFGLRVALTLQAELK